MRDPTATDSKARGHEEYRAWLAAVGECFSPLFTSTTPLRVGLWNTWTVEGLYQGLKLFSIEDLSLVHASLPFRIFQEGPPVLIHIPAIMEVREGLKQNPLFRLLKSGSKYNAKRNQYFGRLSPKRRNWTWTQTWRHPVLGLPVSRKQFIAEVFVPALWSALSQHPAEVSHLRSLWMSGQYLITSDMRQAHGHLHYVEQYVLGCNQE